MSLAPSPSGFDVNPISEERREELALRLTLEERLIILNHGTERAFCGTLLNNKAVGVYACRLCGLPLFRSGEKFESGTGWPSFNSAFDDRHLREIDDRRHGMMRAEIRCVRCDGHLGHVFPDGPPPSFRRYCLNSLSLEFFPAGAVIEQRTADLKPMIAEHRDVVSPPRSTNARAEPQNSWSKVDEASDESFPASDPPAW